MKSITITFPDTLFESTTLVTSINSTEIIGQPHETIKKTKSTEWSSRNCFGFETSDVTSLTNKDKLLMLNRCVLYSNKASKPVEFLFNIYNNTLVILVRDAPKKYS